MALSHLNSSICLSQSCLYLKGMLPIGRVSYVYSKKKFYTQIGRVLQLTENSNFLQMDTYHHICMTVPKSRDELVKLLRSIFLSPHLIVEENSEGRRGCGRIHYCFHGSVSIVTCVNASGPDLFQSHTGQVWTYRYKIQISYHTN